MTFEPLRHILSRSVRSNPASIDLQIARVFEQTNRVLSKLWGEERATTVRSVSFREGTLKLETTSPAAKQQLSVDAARIKNEINRLYGEQIVRSIVVQSKGF
jgi:hypothetical protein